MSLFTQRPLRWLLRASVVLAALLAATWANTVEPGLRARYFSGSTPASDLVSSSIERTISTESLLKAWNKRPPTVFSASWSGWLLVLRSGPYRFQTTSDDGSWLYVDGRRIVDNGGQHIPIPAEGSVVLDRGVHAVRLEYNQLGGDMDLRWQWARADAPLQPIPSWHLSPRRAAVVPFLLAQAIHAALDWVKWLWVVLLLATLAHAGWRRIHGSAPWLRSIGAWPALPLIVLASLVLNGTALWWGLPVGSWPPDELSPKDVAVAVSTHFSNGWYQRYPPFHFYVLAVAHAPMWLLERAGMLEPDGLPGDTLRSVVGRLVSLCAGAGTLWLLFLCGLRLVGSRAALMAVVQFALVAPFVYYSKTANLDVPYLFWFALAFWYLLRFLDSVRLSDVLGYAAAATLSICTKDQAYGLFALPSLLIAHRLWQSHRDERHSLPWLRALVDRRLLIGVMFAMAIFAAAHNLLFNMRGFMAHVDIILGSASQGYRMFPSTLAGEQALLSLTLRMIRTALGWPITVAFALGFVRAWWTPAMRRVALLLTLPSLSYYLTFVAVVGYNYDRFLLPVFFVSAMFGGLAVERWLARPRGRPVAIALLAGALAYTLLYVASIDILMLRDSRYTVERYLSSATRSGERIGYVFPTLYNPRLDAFRNGEVSSVEQLNWERPRWFVLNIEYGRSEPSHTDIGQLVSGLQSGSLGYVPVYTVRTPAPFPWLPAPHRDLTGARIDGPTEVTSSLRHINPTFVVLRRNE